MTGHQRRSKSSLAGALQSNSTKSRIAAARGRFRWRLCASDPIRL